MSDLCPACQESATMTSGLYILGCKRCTARGIGRGPNFSESSRSGVLTRRYRAELETMGITHAEVKAARALDFEAREGATT